MTFNLHELYQKEHSYPLLDNVLETKSKSALMDYHVHDFRSRDAPTAIIENYVTNAELNGVGEIAFTTHLIVEGVDSSTSIRMNEIDDYLNDIWKAQESTDVKLKTGFEVDYFPEHEKSISKLVEEYDLDFVLGSVHQVGKLNITVEETTDQYFSCINISDAINDYYKVWKKAIESGIFDVMSHPDYFRKIIKYNVEWGNYGDVVYDAIKALKKHNVGFEINSSGFRHGISDKFPRDEFIKEAIKEGVNTITLGSDSHMVRTLGYWLRDAAGLLNELGLNNVSTFKARKEHKIPIKKLLST